MRTLRRPRARQFATLAVLALAAGGARAGGPIDVLDELDAAQNSLLMNPACERSVGQMHTLLQPSFPSSGRGWTQKLIFLAMQSAGAGAFNDTHEFKFGYKSFPVSRAVATPRGPGSPAAAPVPVLEWLFTHESDRQTEARMAARVVYPQRPPLVFRVVRSALENVEANYRYVKKEGGKTGPWDKFASDKIQRYRKFHRYWDQRCGYNVPGQLAGAAVLDSKATPCCVTVTYEDLQGRAFLRRSLRKVLQLWAGTSAHLTSEALAKGAEHAVNAVPPKRNATDLFASGKRYTPAHHLALISPLALDAAGKLS